MSELDPHVLYFWDSDADEGRGARVQHGFYRTREAAQAEADKLNKPLLAALNAREFANYEKQMKLWREFKRDTMPTEPVPWRPDQFETWARYPATKNPYGDGPCRAWPWLDHFYVEPLEFDG